MNAKARTARQIIKARRAADKAHKLGLHTAASHALRAGVDPEVASSVGNAVRAKAKTLGIEGRAAVIVRRTAKGTRPVRGAKRYTADEFRSMVASYKPRAAKYVAARELLAAY